MRYLMHIIVLFSIASCNQNVIEKELESKSLITKSVIKDFENIIITGCALPNAENKANNSKEQKEICRDSLKNSGKSILIYPFHAVSHPELKNSNIKQIAKYDKKELIKLAKEFTNSEEQKEVEIYPLIIENRPSRFPLLFPKSKQEFIHLFRNQRDLDKTFGAVFLSEIYFDKKYQTVIVKAKLATSPKSSSSYLYVFKKENKKWVIINKIECCGVS